MNLGGKDVTKYLARLLVEKGFTFSTTAEFQIVREIKDKLCYTSFNYEKDSVNTILRNETSRSFTLPDGQVINL